MVICIIQARMGSARLPGKALVNICGKPMLRHVVERVRRSKRIDRIVIATTQKKEDDGIEALVRDMGLEAFRGDENNVLDRYRGCLKKFGGDVVVRITGDCPLADPLIIDKTIEYFLKNDFDYVSNAYPQASYPDGMDVEVFTVRALEKAWRDARLPSELEHVTPYIWKNEDRSFSLGALKSDVDLSDRRWTVDTEEDLEFVARVYNELYRKDPGFGMQDVLRLLERKPAIGNLNKGRRRNEGYEKSIKEDMRKK